MNTALAVIGTSVKSVDTSSTGEIIGVTLTNDQTTELRLSDGDAIDLSNAIVDFVGTRPIHR
jgi:hypothetical protein